jgi:hypothetical protein
MLNNIKYQNLFCNMLKDRLLEFIKNEGLNPNQFYVKTGLGIGFLDKVGERLKRPSVEKISKTFPHWSIDYLQTGEGDMLRKDVNINDASHSTFNKSNVQQGSNITYRSEISAETIAENSKNYQEIIKVEQEQVSKLQDMFLRQQIQMDRLIGLFEQLNRK